MLALSPLHVNAHVVKALPSLIQKGQDVVPLQFAMNMSMQFHPALCLDQVLEDLENNTSLLKLSHRLSMFEQQPGRDSALEIICPSFLALCVPNLEPVPGVYKNKVSRLKDKI